MRAHPAYNLAQLFLPCLPHIHIAIHIMSSCDSTPPKGSLPAELIHHILSYLIDHSSLAATKATCKHLSTASLIRTQWTAPSQAAMLQHVVLTTRRSMMLFASGAPTDRYEVESLVVQLKQVGAAPTHPTRQRCVDLLQAVLDRLGRVRSLQVDFRFWAVESELIPASFLYSTALRGQSRAIPLQVCPHSLTY